MVDELLLNIEKQYRKLQMREVEFSPEVSKEVEVLYIQRIALKGLKDNYRFRGDLINPSRILNIDLGNLRNIIVI